MKLRVHKLQSIREDLEAVQQRVTARAHQLFRERGGELGRALDDWIRAERELIWRPAVDLTEKNGELCLEMAVAGVEAKDLDIRLTAHDVVVTAPTHHHHRDDGTKVLVCEFKGGHLFRSLRFPRPVNPSNARADYHNGLLRLTVPVAEAVSHHVVVADEPAAAKESVDVQC
jgi:HSP20 family protein